LRDGSYDGLLDLAAKGQRDRHRVHRQAVDEVGGAIERIDDPQVLAVLGAVLAARLFGQDGVAGVGGEQDFDDRPFGRLIDLGDEVVDTLGGDLQPFDVECGAVDDRSGCAGRLDGDVEHRVEGLRHGAT
jgi:hypothetical protein